jgi:hypothetical protein
MDDSVRKIKLNLSDKTYNEMDDECQRLSFMKRDGTPNRSGYVSSLVSSFWPYLRDGKVSEKVDRIFKAKELTQNTVYVEPTKEAIDSFQSVYSFYKDKAYGAAIRELMEKFFTLQSDERERILFSSIYDRIESAIKKKKELTIRTYDRCKDKIFQYYFDPYKICQTSDRIFNYVLGKMYRNNDGNLVTMRLSKIIGVSFASDRFSFSREETEKFEEMIRVGAQFSEYGTYEMKAEFTKDGIAKLHLAYKNRPLILKEEGNIVTFRTNDFASMIYFTQFGEMMTILEPDDLRERILDFHRKAASAENKRAN